MCHMRKNPDATMRQFLIFNYENPLSLAETQSTQRKTSYICVQNCKKAQFCPHTQHLTVLKFYPQGCGFAGMNPSHIPSEKHALSAFSVARVNAVNGRENKAVSVNIGGVTMETYKKGKLYTINISDLNADPNQPRKYLDPQAL